MHKASKNTHDSIGDFVECPTDVPDLPIVIVHALGHEFSYLGGGWQECRIAVHTERDEKLI